MAVVTKYASGYQDPSIKPADLIPAEETQGHNKSLVSTVEIANGDSATSKVYFGKLPSSARINTNSVLEYDAITGVVSFDLGGANSVNALMAAADIHLAGAKDATSNVDIAKLNKPLWFLLGYAADPGGELDIFGTLNNAATAAGTITLSLVYQVAL
jgi:hypothetical protein